MFRHIAGGGRSSKRASGARSGRAGAGLAAAMLALLGGWEARLPAQGSSGSVYISAVAPLAVIRVDGRDYQGQASFFWPPGSKHIVEFPASSIDGLQYDSLRSSRFELVGWKVNEQDLAPSGQRVMAVTASSDLKTIAAVVRAHYRVSIHLYGDPAEGGNLGTASPGSCGGPVPPPTEFRTGLVYLDDVCFWSSVRIWVREGTHSIEAYPYPGFVFLGWIGASTQNVFAHSIYVNKPYKLTARFVPGKRVKFRTDPPGMKVYVDRTPILTPDVEPCIPNGYIVPYAPQSIVPVCTGDFDFAVDSRHVIGAPSPQSPIGGGHWLFDSFSNGMGQNSVYTATSLMPAETIVAKFKRAAMMTVTTRPAGLRIAVDQQVKEGPAVFIFATGSKHEVSAPMEQTGGNGRKYLFRGWSHGGDAAQQVEITPEAEKTGVHLLAEYDLQSQLVVHSAPHGVTLEVDGSACPAPCRVDRKPGSEVRIAAPATHPLGEMQRLEFAGWHDGGDRERTVVVTGSEPTTLTAAYGHAYMLRTVREPAAGGSVRTDPPSVDGFYPEGKMVVISAEDGPGYRFRRYQGDASTASRTTALVMSRPRTVTAYWDKTSTLPPAAVRNAAAETASGAVAPGSLISIFGEKLAAEAIAGPASPLAQALGGVSVVVGDRILPLLFVSPQQINAQLPFDLVPGTYELRVLREGQPAVQGSVTVAACAPGLFYHDASGRAQAVAFHANGEPVTEEHPLRPGELVSIYGTGFGGYRPTPLLGFPLPNEPPFEARHEVALFAGDTPVPLEFAGGAPGLHGTDMLKFRATAEFLAADTSQLRVRVGDQDSNAVHVPRAIE